MSIPTAKLTTFLKALALRAHDMLFRHMASNGLILGAVDLTDPEVKDAIAAAVKEATDGLSKKRDELLAELKAARKGQAIDPVEIEKRDAQIDELQGKLTVAEKAAKTATTEAEKARKSAESESAYVQRLLVDNGLSEALAKAGVTNPVHQKAAKAMLAGQVQITTEGDVRAAKVGDKALTDYVSEWAKGDEGKFFVAAPNNTGGGAGGGNGGSGRAAAPKRSDYPDDISYARASAQHHAAGQQA